MKYLNLWIIFILFINNSYAVSSINPSINPSLISKPAIQLATRYNPDIKIKDYLVSEKLDGVRARWNGEILITRSGHIINAPKWFIQDFPQQILDGELWIGRNRFDEVSAIVRRKIADDKKWQLITFNIFDLPLSPSPFLKRYREMNQLLSGNSSPHIKLIKQKELVSKVELNDWLDLIEEKHGEGLMLHHKESLYDHNRSNKLLKLKKVYDAEAIVIAHLNGKGKYKDMLGALLMEMPNGIQFRLGSGLSDFLRQNPPKIGSTVTYQYYGITKNGKPRFASYLRIRDKN